MAFNLPGLGLSLATQSTPSSTNAPSSFLPPSTAQQTPRTETLDPQTEWRFEVAFAQRYTIRLTNGTAEHWGVELAQNRDYVFSGYKGAVFSWHGCTLEIMGEAESEYLGRETEYMLEWMSVHGMLESARDEAIESTGGPRVLVAGPDSVGKSSLVRCLAAWGVRMGRTPTVVNFDSREGMLAAPGSLSAVTVGGQMDVEGGFGMPPISGPTVAPVKTPLVYGWPFASPLERAEAFKGVVTQVALHTTGKLEADAEAKRSGFLIDTPGAFNDPKSSYDALAHTVAEFSVTYILTIGSERLFNDLNRRWNQERGDEKAIPVLRLTKPGGAIERDGAFMRSLRAQQIRTYFFGPSHTPLNPHSHSVAFADLHIYRAKPTSSSTEDENSNDFQPGGASDDDDYEPDVPWSSTSTSNSIFERITPSAALMASLLAIKFCPGSSADDAALRDSTVMGYVYVAEVDETRKRVRFLAPHPQRWGDQALVWGTFPDAVVDLVT